MTSWIQYLDLLSPSTADDSEALSRSEEPPILLQTDLVNKVLIYVMKIDPHKCADITKDKDVAMALWPGNSRSWQRGV